MDFKLYKSISEKTYTDTRGVKRHYVNFYIKSGSMKIPVKATFQNSYSLMLAVAEEEK